MKINKRQLDRIKKILYGKESDIVYPTKEDISRAAEMLKSCKEIDSWYSFEGRGVVSYTMYRCPNNIAQIILIGCDEKENAVDLAFRLLNPNTPTPMMNRLTVSHLYPRDRPLEHIDVHSLFSTSPL